MSPTTCLLLPRHAAPLTYPCRRSPAPGRAFRRGLVAALGFAGLAVAVAAMIVCPFCCIRAPGRR